MGRAKFINLGGAKQLSKCEYCEKLFDGDKRNVNKLADMHYRVSHGIKYTNLKESLYIEIDEESKRLTGKYKGYKMFGDFKV